MEESREGYSEGNSSFGILIRQVLAFHRGSLLILCAEARAAPSKYTAMRKDMWKCSGNTDVKNEMLKAKRQK